MMMVRYLVGEECNFSGSISFNVSWTVYSINSETINIPEYKLRFYEQDTLRSEHNIVVGKIENATPELESNLKRIVLYPYWTVPYSISSKEILPAVKNNVSYLEKHNYKTFLKDIVNGRFEINTLNCKIRHTCRTLGYKHL